MRRKEKRLSAVILSLVLIFVMSGTFVSAEEPESFSTDSEIEETDATSEVTGETEDERQDEGVSFDEETLSDEKTLPDEDRKEDVTVLSWEWGDGADALQYTGDFWMIGLPGVSDVNPLTVDSFQEVIPNQIVANTGTERVMLELIWDLSGIPEEGLTSGDHTFTAALPEGYELSENAEPLAVTVQLGGTEPYTALPSGNPPYEQRIVNGVSPNGTTINLFDYWITTQTEADNSNGSGTDFLNLGINKGHALIFGNGLDKYTPSLGKWNVWTGDENPNTKIVSNTLQDGYPQLNVDTTTADQQIIRERNGSESLDYLFDPLISVDGKASYEDVQGLLQVDSDGYYYYDSQKNYAVFYQEMNSFTLYNLPGVLPGGNSPVGQFFPFNEATSNGESFGYWPQSYRLMNGNKSDDSSINHYFGLAMSTRFIQQNGGYTDKTGTTPVTYEFSGDDDVWIFIDGILVADLGGIHDAASVNINFATGEIDINGKRQRQNLGDILNTGTDTLKDNTYHTLDFFYLERGNVDSNMQLKYNLVTIPESSVIKIDQTGDPVAGAEFSLYAANDLDNPIATGTTDRNGEFVFLDENDFPITINSLYQEYADVGTGEDSDLILKETSVPEGYRSNGDIGLYFYKGNSDEALLLSNSIWNKGAYAMPKVTATTPNEIQLLETGTGTAVNRTVTLTGSGAEENPLMFAVVFQKQNDGTWLPISGDPLSGWRVEENSDWSSVIRAATKNPYVFQLASSGAYQAEVENLPGDIKTYYHICKDEEKAKYTIAYYYTTASTITSAAADNTWRINSDPDDDEYDLDRVFSMDLYVPNIKNRLLIQKVDDIGATVNGAEFELYRAEQVTVNGDSVDVREGEQPYDSLTTSNVTGILNLEGGGIFPTENHVLEKGEYYLIETSVPGGYKLNSTAVHVVIDDTGVYADAGNADDGVTVLRGVGSVLRSMLQFAADDNVDTTLNSIKAALAQSVQYENGKFIADDANWDNNDQVLHLKYANANGLLDYGLYDEDIEGNIDNLTLATDIGWSRLLIRQCYMHDSSVDVSLKTSLGETDITNLFSGTVTVRVENERTGNLKISKNVTGENAPADQEFTFMVTLKEEEIPVSGEYQTSDGNKIAFNSEGTATLKLRGGESVTILQLPAGAEYTVEETPIPDGYTSSVTGQGDEHFQINTENPARVSGVIPHNTTQSSAAEVNYTNTFDGSVKAVVSGTKTLDGRNLTANDTYRFRIAGNDEFTRTAINNGTVILPVSSEISVTGDGSSEQADFAFDEITFKAAGTYQFAVTEVLPEGADGSVKEGIRYDMHTSVAEVTVTDKNGILSAEIFYDNSGASSASDAGETAKAAFTNTVVADLTFNKVQREGNALGGAGFALYCLNCSDNTHDHSKDEIQAEENGNLAEDYQYKNCWTLVQTAVSDKDSGQVSFTAVPAGNDYRLVEVSVPEGYMNPGGQWTVHFDKETSVFVFGESVGNPPAVKEEGGAYSIVNYMPGELPFSGNKGIMIFMITGGALMGTGVLGFACRMKQKRRMR